jgi:asparagine synthase (glutamine-hydrolysing)
VSGICGVVNFDGAPAERETLQKMAQAAVHRGPDGVHYWTDANAGLAHLALNITLESARERQPLVSKRGDLVLTVDARIDNRSELIHALTTKGYLKEEAPTDADLILAAYQRWGEDCPIHLLGDFAFAVWDTRRKRLFAARDAMAMRAFYYRVEPRRVLFGTEVKQILAAPDVPARIFEPAVGAYLSGCFGPLEWSFYEGISQLAPAHALAVDESGHRVWRYWDVDPDQFIEYRTEDEYVEHFLEIFLEAVRCRLRSAKPVGIFLSGGVDSGSIASMAGWLLRRNGSADWPALHAYSWAFEELPQSDERHISGIIAHHYGFPVTDVPVDEAWPLKDYPAHGPDRDEPFIGAYQALIERTLAAAASNGMGLTLSGDRGDLMVGDVVVDHPGLLWAGELPTLWDQLRAHGRWRNTTLGWVVMSQLLKPLLLNLWPQGTEWALDKRRKLRGYEAPTPYPNWVRSEFAERVGLAEIVQQNEEPQSTNMSGLARRMRYKLVFAFMHMRGMVWSERTGARFGLGFADPWSDRRLAEFVLAVPQWRIQRVREPKRIARQAMRGIMPEEVRKETRKISPNPVYERAIREQARDTILDLIKDSRAAACGYLDEGVLRGHYQSILRGEPDHPGLWWALTLEMWLRRYWS